jgi:inner membrane protein
VFYVLRFGEMNGWAEKHPRLTLYYFLQYPDDNKLVVQRGRVAKWDKKTISNYLKRIGGE